VILYLDASAVVKVYVVEAASDRIRDLVAAAAGLLTVRVSYAEVRAAFARALRERLLSATDLRALTRTFDEDWGRYSIVEVSDALVRQAASLSERHGLRGYDAVQLAAALAAGQAVDALGFVCFDRRLARAASREGLETTN
jgi:predicted nucleic acid-binding protein